MFGLALRGLDALQESGEGRTRVAALKASGAEQLAKIVAFKSHERQLLDENRPLKRQLVTVRVESVMKLGT